MTTETELQADALTRLEPKFIVLEGLDGSGTTTQLALLRDWLQLRSIQVETGFEPTDGPYGSVTRLAIRGRIDVDPETLALGLATDRRDHVNTVINPNLQAGRWFICDRYKLSSLAYQAAQGVEIEWLGEINRKSREPDLTIFIDTPLSVCLQRIGQRSSQRDIFENEARLHTVQENYLKVLSMMNAGTLSHGPLITVNGDQSRSEVFAELIDGLRRHLGEDSELSSI